MRKLNWIEKAALIGAVAFSVSFLLPEPISIFISFLVGFIIGRYG